LRRQFLQENKLPFSEVPLGEKHCDSIACNRGMLEGQDLFNAGHALDLPRAGSEWGPILSRGGCPFDRPSSFARAEPLLGCYRRLPPGTSDFYYLHQFSEETPKVSPS
jgi:hypothetical protein